MGEPITRGEFLKMMTTGAKMVAVATAVDLAIPLSENDRSALLTQSIESSYKTAQDRLNHFLPSGWPKVEIANFAKRESQPERLGRLDSKIGQIGSNIESFSRVDPSVSEMALAGEVDKITNWRGVKDPSMWYLKPGRSLPKADILINPTPVEFGGKRLEVLAVNGNGINDVLMGGIAKYNETHLTPFGQVVGIGEKLAIGEDVLPQRSLFIFDPGLGIVATKDLEASVGTIDGLWTPMGLHPEVSGVCVLSSQKSDGMDGVDIDLDVVSPLTGWRWVRNEKRIRVDKDELTGYGVPKSKIASALKEAEITGLSVDIATDGENIISGYVEVTFDLGKSSKASLVKSFGYGNDVMIQAMESGETQKIIGKVGPATLVAHIRPSKNELGEGEFLGISLQFYGRNIMETFSDPVLSSGKVIVDFDGTEQKYLTITDAESGKLIGRTSILSGLTTPNTEVLGVEEVIKRHDINTTLKKEDYPLVASGNTERIKVSADTVFVYVPGAGGLVPENSINTEMDWEESLHRNVFNAKFGEQGDSMYQKFREEMSPVQNYSDMLTTMQKYGVFFIPWNLTTDKDVDHAMSVPHLNMTIQAFRLISTLKNKEVVLVGHSKGADVVQQMLKMVQEGYVSKMLENVKISGAVMYGRIVPPTELAKTLGNAVYRSYDYDIDTIKGMMEIDELWTGIDSKKLESMGIRTVDVYDPRDPLRYSDRLVRTLLDRPKDLKSWSDIFAGKSGAIISKIFQAHEKEIRHNLPNMNFTPFGTTITRSGVGEDVIASNFDRFLFNEKRSSGDEGSDSYKDYHSEPEWNNFLSAVFEHVDN